MRYVLMAIAAAMCFLFMYRAREEIRILTEENDELKLEREILERSIEEIKREMK